MATLAGKIKVKDSAMLQHLYRKTGSRQTEKDFPGSMGKGPERQPKPPSSPSWTRNVYRRPGAVAPLFAWKGAAGDGEQVPDTLIYNVKNRKKAFVLLLFGHQRQLFPP